ncbi:unnamed protein product [Caenorhabditis sp. 36 PRJEB53466]|nr:unnamed protein product [Caenorhabditis sp. 36 PRJEB53466]
MGKHTKFDSSDDESAHREKRSHHKEKKQERRERSRSPQERREKSPKKDRHEEKSDSRRRDDREHGRRDYGRDERNNWKKDRNDRRNDFQKKDDKNRLSAEEIAAQRKALWGNKKAAEPVKAESTEAAPEASGKNEKLWSSAIAATGVDSSQANKFMRLMGVKNAPKPTEDSSNLSNEKNRQDKMLNDLERQYKVARETTHMGRGNGLGFGH